MSHLANDMVTDNKLDILAEEDTTEAWYEQEVEAQERAEWYADNSYNNDR
jgi:hypothetical protein